MPSPYIWNRHIDAQGLCHQLAERGEATQTMLGHTDDIDDIQAGLLRTLASAHRLRIIHRLGVESCGVTELARDLGLNQAAASQHLAVMRGGRHRRRRPRRAHRDATQLSDLEILAACGLMRSVLVRRLSRLGDLAAAAGPAGRRRSDRRVRSPSGGEAPMSEALSIVLFSGTDDKLHAAATIAVGAVAMDRPVNILLMYWALDAFRADRISQGPRPRL